MNTFIANTSDGSKVGFQEGKTAMNGLAAGLEAKYCDCDENTTNTSEIADWETAENMDFSALKTEYVAARNACDATTKAAFKAMEQLLKSILDD